MVSRTALSCIFLWLATANQEVEQSALFQETTMLAHQLAETVEIEADAMLQTNLRTGPTLLDIDAEDWLDAEDVEDGSVMLQLPDFKTMDEENKLANIEAGEPLEVEESFIEGTVMMQAAPLRSAPELIPLRPVLLSPEL